MSPTHRSRCQHLLGACAVAASLGGLILPASPAQAQDDAAPPAAANTSDDSVDALVQQGIDRRRAGQDEEALRAFEAAEAKDPESVRVHVHLAATHQALGHWLQADRYLQGVLARADDPYVRRHRQTLEKAVEFVAHHIGSIEVGGSPRGAEVRIDGRQLGVLPLAATKLAVGAYQLEVSQPGHYPVRRPVVVSEGGVLRESVELAPVVEPASAPAPTRLTSTPLAGDAPAADRAAGSPRWLSWTLTGLATGAAVTTGVAFALRERHATRWNSDDCQQVGRLRGELCPDEHAAVTRCGITWAGAACAGSF
jgi:PEGA domain-containing protein/tetratricopeptide repeat protein